MRKGNMETYQRLIFLIGVGSLSLGACAPLKTTEEIMWRRQTDADNWHLCKRVYKESNFYTVSRHSHSKHKVHKPYEIKEDLIDNSCRRALGAYWIEY